MNKNTAREVGAGGMTIIECRLKMALCELQRITNLITPTDSMNFDYQEAKRQCEYYMNQLYSPKVEINRKMLLDAWERNQGDFKSFCSDLGL